MDAEAQEDIEAAEDGIKKHDLREYPLGRRSNCEKQKIRSSRQEGMNGRPEHRSCFG